MLTIKLQLQRKNIINFDSQIKKINFALFIVDNFAYITGGRNVGSNYFYPETASNFSDTDVLFIGDMTKFATNSFNEYWNHHLSIPAEVFPKAKSKKALKKLKAAYY